MSCQQSSEARAAAKVFYEDDPDPFLAGQGLAFAPFVSEIVEADDLGYWMMSAGEQVGLLHIVRERRPRVSIEIGTRLGGSLQVLARFSEKVYSLDIDPDVSARLKGKHANVEYIIGPSRQTLPMLLDRLTAEGAEVGFVLVDGDHSSEAVRTDIDLLLRYTPICPMFIMMHDSSNPKVRKGLKGAGWTSNPHVQFVELDFIAGGVHPSPALATELWGGLCLALLTPEKRSGRFEVTGRSELNVRYASRPMRVIRKQVRAVFDPKLNLQSTESPLRTLGRKVMQRLGPRNQSA